VPNLFFYVGTIFLREDASLPDNVGKEAQFALRNLLPDDMGWETVCNTNSETAGKPDVAGKRSFTYSNGGVTGASLLEGLMSSFKNSALQAVVSEDVESTAVLASAQGKVKIHESEISNSSGRISKEELDGLIAELVQRVKGRGQLFSVADCNSFHNVAYILGSVALHRKPAPVLLINIDQHKDIGGVDKFGFVASDRWATSMLASLSCGAYVVLGSGGSGSGSQIACQVKLRDGNPTNVKLTSLPKQTLVGSGLASALETAFDTLQGDEYLDELFQSVYITVDRDCMRQNWTQWGERAAVIDNYQEVIKILTAVMTALKNIGSAKLVGMDITGLPEYGCGPGSSLDPIDLLTGKTSSSPYKYSDMRKEIAAYHDFFSTWANTGVVSSGGIFTSPSAGLRCCTCGNEHGSWRSSALRRWHKCTTCERIYCPQCGSKMKRSDSWIEEEFGGISMERTRLCTGIDFNGTACTGETELID
jgi:hypothetical protein